MSASIEQNQQKAAFESLFDLTKRSDIHRHYANGFQCGATLGDATIVLKENEVSTAIISMSLPALKTLAIQIQAVITAYQDDLGMPIDSFEEAHKKTEAFRKANGK